jgi:serine protease AprX
MLATPSGTARRTPVRRLAAATGLAALLVGAATGVVPAAPASAVPGSALSAGGGRVSVIIRADNDVAASAAQVAVVRSGGTVGRSLGLIAGFAAEVPQGAVAALQALPGVAGVTVDAAVQLQTDTWLGQIGKTVLSTVVKGAGGDKADKDDDKDEDDSDDATDAPLTGAGIGIALIDSGVAPVKGLTGAGKIINGPDLSFESQAPDLRYLDTFGHGTHLAGILAGQDPPAARGAARFDGVAPGARIISLKVAAADGATDVSQVIAAIDWVVAHRDDAGLNIRVLNLSFGTDSTQSATLDPLSYAVEQAWKKGIVVVVAVGNDGAQQSRVTMPAANPYVIAVGAADPNGTTGRADDVVADFSTRGNASRHADVIAAGRSVVSLRNPGSYVDTTYPGARLTDDPEQRYFRGSGTSQAAAVVSGAVALLLEQRPKLAPDEVKRLLMTTADPIVGGDAYASGAGQLDIAEAAATKTPKYKQVNLLATGLGSLEASRGSAHVYDSQTGTVLTGEKDIFGNPWVPTKWNLAAGSQKSWSGGTWNGSPWAGTAWGGSVWTARAWSAGTWTARTWSGSTWTARTWSNAVWNGRTWSARTWSARTWSGRTWSSATWPGEPWQ